VSPPVGKGRREEDEPDPPSSCIFHAAAREPTRCQWRRHVEEMHRHCFLVQEAFLAVSWIFRGLLCNFFYLCDVFVLF